MIFLYRTKNININVIIMFNYIFLSYNKRINILLRKKATIFLKNV